MTCPLGFVLHEVNINTISMWLEMSLITPLTSQVGLEWGWLWFTVYVIFRLIKPFGDLLCPSRYRLCHLEGKTLRVG